LEKKIASGIILTLLLISMSTLAFNIQPVKSDRAWTENIFIRADGSVDPDTAPVSTVDNITYTLTDNIVGDVPYGASAIAVESDNIVVDGADYTVQSTESGTGIDLSYRSNVTLKNVEIKNFGNHGIYLYHSSNNTLTSNTVSNNYEGICLSDSSNDNVITGNNVSSNQNRGINLHYSRDNTFVGNTVSKNLYGIYAFYFSSDNTFFHNNLLDNTFQAYTEWNANRWDDGYPSGGNYWSDYAGVDEKAGLNQDLPGIDAIGDTPYTIDAENRDRYPLVDRWVERKPGVKAGDWAKYGDYVVVWNSNDPGQHPPTDIQE